MTSFPSRIALSVAALVAASLLVSCSSDDDTGADAPADRPESRTLTPDSGHKSEKAASRPESRTADPEDDAAEEPAPSDEPEDPEPTAESDDEPPAERPDAGPSRTRIAPNLPAGDEGVLDGRRMVALYGVPGTPSLGALGEQPLDASITRVKKLAEQYEKFTDDEVVPTFEIIASVASTSAGGDGDFSSELSLSSLRPWVERAAEEGVYVVLDLQPGRNGFERQAKRYAPLLKYPHVGLALDPEWRLGPNQRHLEQIGSVHGDEVNATIDWLADLTRQEKLPQKLVVLHQFRTSMIVDRKRVRTDRDEVEVLIHADGQGAQAAKRGTWRTLHQGAPKDVRWGWKNFIDEDHPMLTPKQTYQVRPRPDFVSYQ
ncbi:hypothetical protein MU582_16890 [Nocardioidaceae bacterium SCSIO 66511]|nr:hypothetical protein MU582_16890 [Nocardioidaceae bacterium SCSIO 66511]